MYFSTSTRNRKTIFLKLLDHMVVESNQEDGCLLYELWKDTRRQNWYALIEHWRDQGALDAHARTKHWIHFNDTVDEYLQEHYGQRHYSEP